MSTAQRLHTVLERIASAATRAGRTPESVRLIAVSKAKPAAAIEEAYAAGQRDFGENYVQELLAKAETLAHLSDLRWHMLGHLQRNKARLIATLGCTVHSVDSGRLVEELDRRRAALRADGSVQGAWPVLIEVNLGREAQKGGVPPEDVRELVGAARAASSLELRGLMTVPPQTLEGPALRACFEQLAALREELGGAAQLPELSMGMSADFEDAIACGATIVRVGTAIFGERPAKEPG